MATKEELQELADQEVEDNYDPNHQTLVVEARKHGGTTYKTPTYLKIAHNVLANRGFVCLLSGNVYC